MDNLDLIEYIEASHKNVTDFSKVSSGTFKQTQDYIDNINSEEYKDYLVFLNDYFIESTKKNKKKFNFFVTDNGSFVKKCKPGNTKTKEEITIVPPLYYDVNQILKEITNDKDKVEYEILEIRDELFNDPDNDNLLNKFNKLKVEYIELNDKYKIFNDYLMLVNQKDINKSELLVEKATIRNELRELFNEIKVLKKENNHAKLEEKIREYLKKNTILDIEMKIKEIDENLYINKIVSSLPIIKKGEPIKRILKKKILKKKKPIEEKNVKVSPSVTPKPPVIKEKVIPSPKTSVTPKPQISKKTPVKISNTNLTLESPTHDILQEDLDLLKSLEPKKSRLKKKYKGGAVIMTNLLDSVDDDSSQELDVSNLLNNVKVIKLN